MAEPGTPLTRIGVQTGDMSNRSFGHISAEFFSEFLKSKKMKNSFVLTVLEFNKLNGQMYPAPFIDDHEVSGFFLQTLLKVMGVSTFSSYTLPSIEMSY
jgi:hypothetical protein